MHLAASNVVIDPVPGRRSSSRRRKDTGSHSVRSKTIAAIHLTWKKLRRDLSDADESREQRLTFMAGVLKKDSISSTRDLTDRQLGRVLDAMRELERAPELPGMQVIHRVSRSETTPATAEIIHLATAAQVSALKKLLAHLGWRAEAQEGFIEKRFHRKSVEMLSPKDAHSLTMILLNIAASNAVRSRGVKRASRLMIGDEIPRIKRLLGIDQKSTIDEDDG